MKKIFFIISIILFSEIGYSQFVCGKIVSDTALPIAATTNDSVWINLHTMCYVSMQLDHYTVSSSGNTYVIQAFYCYGMLQVVTTTNDSIPLGVLPAGNYTYQVNAYLSDYTTNCMGYTPSDQEAGSFTVSPNQGSGIENNFYHNNFNIYPNPFIDKLEITLPYKDCSNIEFKLYDINGRKMELPNHKMENEKLILYPNVISGIYILEITLNGKKYYQKVIR